MVLFFHSFKENRIGDKGLEAITSVLRRMNPSPCPSLLHLNVCSILQYPYAWSRRHQHHCHEWSVSSQVNPPYRWNSQCRVWSYLPSFPSFHLQITQSMGKAWASFFHQNTGKPSPSLVSCRFSQDWCDVDTKVNEMFDLFAKSTMTKSYNLKHLILKSMMIDDGDNQWWWYSRKSPFSCKHTIITFDSCYYFNPYPSSLGNWYFLSL